jgi:hypothetical protein
VKYKKKHLIATLELMENAGNFPVDVSYAPNDDDLFVFKTRGGGQREIPHPKGVSSAEIQFYLTLLLREKLIIGQKYWSGNFGCLSLSITGLQQLEELRDQAGWRLFATRIKSGTGVLITHVAIPIIVTLLTVMASNSISSYNLTPEQHERP